MVLALLSLTLLMIDGSALRQRGRTFLTFIAFLCGSVLVWIGYDYSQQYSTWFSLTVGFLLALGALGVFIVLLTEAHELAETAWTRTRRRPFLPVLTDTANVIKSRLIAYTQAIATNHNVPLDQHKVRHARVSLDSARYRCLKGANAPVM